MLKNHRKSVFIAKRTITKKINVDLNTLNYALNPKKKNNTIVTKIKKVAMSVFNTSSIKNFDVTKYEKLAYFSFNTCKFAYHSEINRIRFILDFEATIYICCEKAYFREIISCNSIVL